jgi:hypothetical protein
MIRKVLGTGSFLSGRERSLEDDLQGSGASVFSVIKRKHEAGADIGLPFNGFNYTPLLPSHDFPAREKKISRTCSLRPKHQRFLCKLIHAVRRELKEHRAVKKARLRCCRREGEEGVPRGGAGERGGE